MKTRRGRTTSPPGSLSQEDVRVRKVGEGLFLAKKKLIHFPQVCKSAGTWGAWPGGAVQPGRNGEATTFLDLISG